MQAGSDLRSTAQRPRASLLYDPKLRSVAAQALLCAVIAYLTYSAASNAIENLARAKIATGFGFWDNTAGFDISQTLIEYSQVSTYGRAFWVGLLNTLLVASLGIVFATLLGFVIGIARLSHNLLVSRLASAYVEAVRNIPLLLQLYFWYNAVLKALPGVRGSVVVPGGGLLNNRGLFLPRPEFGAAMNLVVAALAAGLVGTIAFRFWARQRQQRTGAQAPVLLVSLGLIIGLPILAFLAAGMPVEFGYPELGRFNIRGGIEILPEFVALLLGLVIYTAAFIAEVVRAGISSVSHGQTEAAQALGLRAGSITLRW